MRLFQGLILTITILFLSISSYSQNTIIGSVIDAVTNEPIFSAYVISDENDDVVTTDFDGKFKLEVKTLPTTLTISYIGYKEKKMNVTSVSKPLVINLSPDEQVLEAAEVVGERISEKQKQEPLTVQTMDVLAIKEAPSGSFYESLGNLKGVDMTSASLGFKIINTRGFNSTSPVRSLQLIDGVDNQSPGLNFSLGNFLGASDLDVMKVDIIAGASSAFYGPGAFNGVVNMTTKDPFLFPGFSMYLKKGERGLYERALRYAKVISNKDGEEKFAFKVNWFFMEANDWEAEDYSPIYESDHDESNPYGFDAVNIYGDEPVAANNDFSDDPFNKPALGTIYRNGYKEKDLVDYETNNMKFNTGLYYKIKSDVVVNYGFNYSTGSTVYQGDNRYALKDIEFFQHKAEIKKEGKWFVRAYTTSEDAGNTYDIVTTAIRLQEASGSTADWNTRFVEKWDEDAVWENPRYGEILAEVQNSGLEPDEQLAFFQQLLSDWSYEDYDFFHDLYLQAMEEINAQNTTFIDPFYKPGTARYDSLFNDVTNRKFTDGGSLFYDRSSLYHVQGEYKIETDLLNITVGGNLRWYRPDSQGTIFSDTLSYTYQLDTLGNYVLDNDGQRIPVDSIRTVIKNREWGIFVGLDKNFLEDKLKSSLTVRVDKNENFDYLISPAASLVYSPNKNHTFRASFSSAVRNPTLADQYLYYNVGRAILLGNIDGRFEEGSDSLFTIESFSNYRNSISLLTGLDTLEYFNVEKIRPEKVKTIEGGYRGTLFDKTYIDLGAYYSVYTDFIGYNIGLNAEFNELNGFPEGGIQVYRVAANAKEKVTTTGFSIGLNYFFKKLSLSGNYSYNELINGGDDPIIPAFNTPKNKYNFGLSGRDLVIGKVRNIGFGINYKWIQGFLFEGSPQFTGNIDSYDFIDAQINIYIPKLYSTLKIGGSNIMGLQVFFDENAGGFGEKLDQSLNNSNLQVYGGPLVGRILYASVLFELK